MFALFQLFFFEQSSPRFFLFPLPPSLTSPHCFVSDTVLIFSKFPSTGSFNLHNNPSERVQLLSYFTAEETEAQHAQSCTPSIVAGI